jgi:iron complex outermembrane receptor protein
VEPSNGDVTGLEVGALSQAPSKQDQWTQEVRWSGDFSSSLSGVFGLYAFEQAIESNPVHSEEAGADAWRFLAAPGHALATSALYDGYGSAITSELNTVSAALFGKVDWAITDRLHLLPGLRLNYDQKDVNLDRSVYGGPAAPTPEQRALLLAVYSPQSFVADVDDTNTSGQLTLSYQATDDVNFYATYATSFKSVGLNLGGLPTDAAGQTILAAATIEPEDVSHVELGVKTRPTPRSTANVTLFNTEVEDFQAQVNNAQFGIPRGGYLANAEKVRVRGLESTATSISALTSRCAVRSLIPTARTCRSRMRPRRSRAPVVRRSSTSPPASSRVSRDGRHRSAASSLHRVPRWVAPARCLAASTSITATPARRAPRRRST